MENLRILSKYIDVFICSSRWSVMSIGAAIPFCWSLILVSILSNIIRRVSTSCSTTLIIKSNSIIGNCWLLSRRTVGSSTRSTRLVDIVTRTIFPIECIRRRCSLVCIFHSLYRYFVLDNGTCTCWWAPFFELKINWALGICGLIGLSPVIATVSVGGSESGWDCNGGGRGAALHVYHERFGSDALKVILTC